MPQRQATKRVNTAAVQGEDSYAVVRRISVGEAKSLFVRSRQKAIDLQAELAKAVQQYETSTVDEGVKGLALSARCNQLLVLSREQPDANADMTTTLNLLATHVTEWNWVDDDGVPLPLPKDDASVMDRLTDAELQVLSNALQGPDAVTGKA